MHIPIEHVIRYEFHIGSPILFVKDVLEIGSSQYCARIVPRSSPRVE